LKIACVAAATHTVEICGASKGKGTRPIACLC